MKIERRVEEIDQLKEENQTQLEKKLGLQKQYEELVSTRTAEIEKMKETQAKEVEELQSQIDDIKLRLANINAFRKIQVKVEEEKQNMVDELDRGRKKHAEVLEGIDNDKIMRIEKMRRDMLYKIKEVKQNMLNLNEDKLQGTTRLTIR